MLLHGAGVTAGRLPVAVGGHEGAGVGVVRLALLPVGVRQAAARAGAPPPVIVRVEPMEAEPRVPALAQLLNL